MEGVEAKRGKAARSVWIPPHVIRRLARKKLGLAVVVEHRARRFIVVADVVHDAPVVPS